MSEKLATYEHVSPFEPCAVVVGAVVVVDVVSVVVEVEVVSVGVVVVVVVEDVSSEVVGVEGDSVQLALPVLHPLQLWNGSLSSDRRKHWWLSARKV